MIKKYNWQKSHNIRGNTDFQQISSYTVLIEKTDETEAPILWPPDEKSQLTGKDPDAVKCWRQKGEGGGKGWDGWIQSPTQ